MDHLAVRSFTIGGREGWEAHREISVEVGDLAVQEHFERFRGSGWACRWSVLYGTVEEYQLERGGEDADARVLPKCRVRVLGIWDPPQRAGDEAYCRQEQSLGKPPRFLQAPGAARAAEQAAAADGLQKVGWLFTCPPRVASFTLRGEEVLQAACLQLEAADGYGEGEPALVTLRMSIVQEEGQQPAASVPQCELTAWCATAQAMEMRAKGFFDVRPEASRFRDAVRVAEGFHVVQEGRAAEEVDVSFLHRPLRIVGNFSQAKTPDFSGGAAEVAKCSSMEQEVPAAPQVTRWAPRELREQFAFIDAGQGQRLGGSMPNAKK